MKRTYQIDERKAIEKFRSYLVTNPGSIQMVMPLAEIAQRLRHGVSQMLLQTERELLGLIMLNEAAWLSGEGGERWGTAPGSVIIHGQKVPIERPRVRQQDGEMKLGSYELFREEETMQRQIWERVMRGLTMRGYGPAVRECAPAFGINKSAVSDRFIAASGQRVEDLRKRNSVETPAVRLADGWRGIPPRAFLSGVGDRSDGFEDGVGLPSRRQRKPTDL